MGRDLTTIPIQGYEEFYTISENGDIFRIARIHKTGFLYKLDEPVRVTERNTNGTITVNLHANKKTSNRSLAKLVYEHFKGKVHKHQIVIQKDGDITNCHVNNLERVDFELHMSRKHLNKKK